MKLLFIDHEMHRTTQSARFFVDLLRKNFDVTQHSYAQVYRTEAAAAMRGQDIAVIWEFPVARGRFFSVGSGMMTYSFLSVLFQNIYSFFIGNRAGLADRKSVV